MSRLAFLISAVVLSALLSINPSSAQVMGGQYPGYTSPYGYWDWGWPTYSNSYVYSGWGTPYRHAYGYPYNTAYGWGSYDYGDPLSFITAPLGAITAPVTGVAGAAAATPFNAASAATAPLATGRSVAETGRMCTSPRKSCELYHASWIGNGCSCKVHGGWARGTVTP
ncbi:MAG TPA: hypothetical protein VEK34_13750 [Methylocella sp.]|nr:hypothetical protein [Methylocella sp.]